MRLFTLLLVTLLSPIASADLKPSFLFEKPDLSLVEMKKLKQKANFRNLKSVNRGTGTSIFKNASPSVVKILTNEGSGSGVILSRDGLILTNNHVIEGYSKVGVIFSTDSDSEKVTIGDVIRIDEISDLALVKISDKTPGLIPLPISREKVQIGEDVHAIGHPLGEDWTYTRGYISQLRADYTWQTGITEHHIADVIQTQTPINPGNSGGPLLNENGELIGINTFGNVNGQGLNFSLSLSTVEKFLLSKKNIVRKKANIDFTKLISAKDINNNGQLDAYYLDDSENEKIDMISYDRNEDELIEEIQFDENENGIIELIIKESDIEGVSGVLYLFDENEDDVIEAIGIDEDSNGTIDSVTNIE